MEFNTEELQTEINHGTPDRYCDGDLNPPHKMARVSDMPIHDKSFVESMIKAAPERIKYETSRVGEGFQRIFIEDRGAWVKAQFVICKYCGVVFTKKDNFSGGGQFQRHLRERCEYKKLNKVILTSQQPRKEKPDSKPPTDIEKHKISMIIAQFCKDSGYTKATSTPFKELVASLLSLRKSFSCDDIKNILPNEYALQMYTNDLIAKDTYLHDEELQQCAMKMRLNLTADYGYIFPQTNLIYAAYIDDLCCLCVHPLSMERNIKPKGILEASDQIKEIAKKHGIIEYNIERAILCGENLNFNERCISLISEPRCSSQSLDVLCYNTLHPPKNSFSYFTHTAVSENEVMEKVKVALKACEDIAEIIELIPEVSTCLPRCPRKVRPNRTLDSLICAMDVIESLDSLILLQPSGNTQWIEIIRKIETHENILRAFVDTLGELREAHVLFQSNMDLNCCAVYPMYQHLILHFKSCQDQEQNSKEQRVIAKVALDALYKQESFVKTYHLAATLLSPRHLSLNCFIDEDLSMAKQYIIDIGKKFELQQNQLLAIAPMLEASSVEKELELYNATQINEHEALKDFWKRHKASLPILFEVFCVVNSQFISETACEEAFAALKHCFPDFEFPEHAPLL